MEKLRSKLVKWSVRHNVVATLDECLLPADAGGRRHQRVSYGQKAGGEAAGRRYVTSKTWRILPDEQLRCHALQGIPGSYIISGLPCLQDLTLSAITEECEVGIVCNGSCVSMCRYELAQHVGVPGNEL